MLNPQANPYEFIHDEPEVEGDRQTRILDPMTMLGIVSAVIPAASIGGFAGLVAFRGRMPTTLFGIDGAILAFGGSAIVSTLLTVGFLLRIARRRRRFW